MLLPPMFVGHRATTFSRRCPFDDPPSTGLCMHASCGWLRTNFDLDIALSFDCHVRVAFPPLWHFLNLSLLWLIGYPIFVDFWTQLQARCLSGCLVSPLKSFSTHQDRQGIVMVLLEVRALEVVEVGELEEFNPHSEVVMVVIDPFGPSTQTIATSHSITRKSTNNSTPRLMVSFFGLLFAA